MSKFGLGQGLYLGFLPGTGKGPWVSPLLEPELELELRRTPEKVGRKWSSTECMQEDPCPGTSPVVMLQGNLPGGEVGGATSEVSVKGKALAQSLVSKQESWAWVGG